MENRTEKCWVLDRESNRSVVSIASTGFGFCAWAIAAERGDIKKEEAVAWINKGLDNAIKANPNNRGWLYHWTDLDGNPVYNKEVASIDTALFYWGARRAAQILGDKPLQDRIEVLISSIDKDWMMKDGYFSHGLIWDGDKPVFFKTTWQEYSEGWLIYKLFGMPYKPTKVAYNLPLFVYYYPLCFCDDQVLVDQLGKAIDEQTKDQGVFGFTACDGPNGYGVMEPNVVSPLAVWSCEPYFPKQAKATLDKLNVPPTTPAYHLVTNWKSQDRIGIDDGACLVIRNKAKVQR